MATKDIYERSFFVSPTNAIGRLLKVLHRWYTKINPITYYYKVDTLDGNIQYKFRTKTGDAFVQHAVDIEIKKEDYLEGRKQAIGYDKLTVIVRPDGAEVLKREYLDGYVFYYTEFETESPNEELTIPRWVGKEFTGIQKYRGYQMAIDHFVKPADFSLLKESVRAYNSSV